MSLKHVWIKYLNEIKYVQNENVVLCDAIQKLTSLNETVFVLVGDDDVGIGNSMNGTDARKK